MPEDMAQADANIAQAENRQPGCHLTLATRLNIIGLFDGQGQRDVQLANRLHGQGIRHRLGVDRPQGFDCVVERLDAGRRPQLPGGRQGDLGIEHNRLGHDAGIDPQPLDPGGLIGDPGKGGKLARRQRGRNRNLGHVGLGLTVFEQFQSYDLGRINRAAAAKADDGVGLALARHGHGFVNRMARHVLFAAVIRTGPALSEQGLKFLDQIGFGR